MSDAPLFDLLDAVVRADRHRPRIPGRIAVGVLGAHGTSWWSADLRERLAVTRSDARPEADAWLLTTGTEARRWARGEGLSEAPRVRLAGDRRLLERFAEAYLGRTDLLGVRTDRGGR